MTLITKVICDKCGKEITTGILITKVSVKKVIDSTPKEIIVEGKDLCSLICLKEYLVDREMG